MRRDPRSPCLTCRFYRRLAYVEGGWAFTPHFASLEDEHAWCVLGVLDRCPQILERAEGCSHWVSRDFLLV